ncbi:MAG TPA: sialidase family protein [Gemmatales bacterium]|nr:sialidase family protein [Gemmatales bacterium]
MVKLQDCRIALTYGNRSAPYGIRAKISDDKGKTWGPEIILRDDGGNWDLGYPRTVQRRRQDGHLLLFQRCSVEVPLYFCYHLGC